MAARKMRMAISLRLAARSFLMGLSETFSFKPKRSHTSTSKAALRFNILIPIVSNSAAKDEDCRTGTEIQEANYFNSTNGIMICGSRKPLVLGGSLPMTMAISSQQVSFGQRMQSL